MQSDNTVFERPITLSVSQSSTHSCSRYNGSRIRSWTLIATKGHQPPGSSVVCPAERRNATKTKQVDDQPVLTNKGSLFKINLSIFCVCLVQNFRTIRCFGWTLASSHARASEPNTSPDNIEEDKCTTADFADKHGRRGTHTENIQIVEQFTRRFIFAAVRLFVSRRDATRGFDARLKPCRLNTLLSASSHSLSG